MFPQITWLREYRVTLVAFVWLFPIVRLQMCPQIAWLNSCKVTLVAFVWFFSSVRFQMYFQNTCRVWCIIALAAFIWPFSKILFHCYQVSTVKVAGKWELSKSDFVYSKKKKVKLIADFELKFIKWKTSCTTYICHENHSLDTFKQLQWWW